MATNVHTKFFCHRPFYFLAGFSFLNFLAGHLCVFSSQWHDRDKRTESFSHMHHRPQRVYVTPQMSDAFRWDFNWFLTSQLSSTKSV